MTASLTQEGIESYKRGDKETARRLLRTATVQDPADVMAWLYLAGAAETDQERAGCLVQVLKLDSTNIQAAKGLAQMVSSGKVQISVPGKEPVVTPPDSSTLASARNLAIPGQETIDPEAEVTLFAIRPSFIPVILYGVGGLLIVIILMAFIVSVSNGGFLGGLATLLAIFFIPTMVGVIAYGLLLRLFTHYTLTNKRLIVESGILSRSKKTIPIQRIQDVSFRQSLVERLFEIGDVVVESAGERGAIRLLDLAHCMHRTEQILRQVEYAIKLGVHSGL
ncbi:MAG TPA: PH domain-containing protein [candidate division Zixibacteria bacterium]|nr:PH domain-containing protein [candidate division Zixibacteria bacterium]